MGRTSIGVQQAGGAHELLDHESAGFLEFVVGGGRAHVDLLACELLELLELERTVVGGCGKPESVVYQYRLAGVVAAVHRVYLRQGHVALVDEGYEVLGEVVDQAERALTLLASVEVAGVVLDAGAVAHLLDHLEVVFHPLLEALGLEFAAAFLEELHLPDEVVLNMGDRGDAALLGGHEVVRGIYAYLVDVLDAGAGHRIDDAQGVDLVAEELDAHGIVGAAEEHVDGVPAHAEGAALELDFGAVVERVDELVEQAGEAAALSPAHHDRLLMEVVGVAYAVETGNGGDDYDVAASGKQGAGGAEAQFLYLVVDAQVLLDVGVARRDVGLGLVVVVVADEVLHGVGREEGLEFAVELGREGLVVAEYQGRTLQALYDVGHREGLARTRHAEQRDVAHALAQGRTELVDRFGLVAGWLVVGFELEFHRLPLSG